MADLVISEAMSDDDREACYGIRITVFCGEQKVSREIEFDGLDAVCRHYLARQGGTTIGTARTRPLGEGVVKFERIAVLKAFRGRDIGRALMDRALADAREDGHSVALLNSQTHASEFYEKMGFLQEGDEFEEAGIPHVRMTQAL